MTATPLPEVRESEAPPEIRAIYDDIKAATAIPQVNLIFRHLACTPAVLAWAWNMIGPLYRDGAIDTAVSALTRELDATATDTPPVWTGLPDADAAALRDVLAFYNRGNPSNLIGLTALVRAAKAANQTAPAQPQASAARHPASSSARVTDVPPLPKYAALSDAPRALIDDLASRQGGAAIGVVPSLYLHISVWPEALRAAHASVLPMLDEPRLAAAVARTISAAGELANGLAQRVTPPAERPAHEITRGYLDTVETFVAATIPEMVVIGRHLAGRTPA